MEQSLKRIPRRCSYLQIFEPGLAVLSSAPQSLSHFTVHFIFQRKVNFPLTFPGAIKFSWKGGIQLNRPSQLLTVADLHPKSGSSGVSCSPEQPTSLSTSELEAEAKRNLKAELALFIVPVGNCPCMWLEGLLKRPPIPTFPFLPAITDSLGLKSRSQAMPLAEPLQIPSCFEISDIK